MINESLPRAYTPLSRSDIEQFESECGVKLPESFRDFLLKSNGGSLNRMLNAGSRSCYIESFFAITDRPLVDSLGAQIDDMRNDLPPGVIPIGLAGGGDRICLALQDGRILLWDHEVECNGGSITADDLVCLAADIFELLTQVEGQEVHEEEDVVDAIGRRGNLNELRRFLEEGNDINRLSNSGGSIVASAAGSGHQDFVEECLRRGATSRFALHRAVLNGDLEMVGLLLRYGANPNEPDEGGNLPLDFVPIQFYQRGAPIVELLKEAGAVRSARAD